MPRRPRRPLVIPRGPGVSAPDLPRDPGLGPAPGGPDPVPSRPAQPPPRPLGPVPVAHATAVSIPAAGRGPGRGRRHRRRLSDGGLAVRPVSGCCCLCRRVQQKGHSGRLQPEPAGEGRVPRGDVEPGAAACRGEAGVRASRPSEGEPRAPTATGLTREPQGGLRAPPGRRGFAASGRQVTERGFVLPISASA